MAPKTANGEVPGVLDGLLQEIHSPQDPDQEVLRSLSEAFLMASDDKAWAEATTGLAEKIQAHRASLSQRLSRDPGEVVSSLDYLVNEIKDPRRILRLRNAALAQAARLALLDSLTGLYNLIYLDLVLPGRIERSKESRQSLALIMLDLDGFGAFNKKYGHLGGNQGLVLVAETLKSLLPPSGVAGRFGGDEFWVLLPGFNRRSGLAFMEEFLKVLGSKPVALPEGGEAPPLKAGQGLACFPADGLRAEDLLSHADKALVSTKADRSRALRVYEPTTSCSLIWAPAPGRHPPSRVSVAGDFNGWDPEADPLIPMVGGSWEARLKLEPGRYDYKFVVDGYSWESDSQALESQPDGFGGINSVLRVGGRREEEAAA